jgi:hypothetical protein
MFFLLIDGHKENIILQNGILCGCEKASEMGVRVLEINNKCLYINAKSSSFIMHLTTLTTNWIRMWTYYRGWSRNVELGRF